MKLSLGTAQIGLDYGIANTRGRIPFEEARKIFSYAETNGIDTIDTAIGYGESESVIGKITGHDWKIISKLPSAPDDIINIDKWVEKYILSSIERLQVDTLYGYLFHNAAQLDSSIGHELYHGISEIKKKGYIKKIGVSIYLEDELEFVLNNYDIDIVQLPFNVFDRRFLNSNYLSKLSSRNIEIHARSIFLQGLLLRDRNDIPSKFYKWIKYFNCWYEYIEETKYSPLDICLGYVDSFPEITKIVVGIDGLEHLKEIIFSYKSNKKIEIPSELSVNNPDLIDPRRWN